MPYSWAEAECYCLYFGANLASIHSLDEYRFVQELVKRKTGTFTQTWIGATDAVQNNMWFWSDGSRFDFQFWSWKEPSDYLDREACIEMNYGGRLGARHCITLKSESEMEREVVVKKLQRYQSIFAPASPVVVSSGY
ncbi:ladderlectin-like [Myripristis murdjan]|uniref:ladderlectin-like n=1 Tax=Myripristis murdjan TaxID=586833 RepID=UPI0011762D33|nr:ladderlectin-like [Myripristis murdjan]